MPRNKIVHAIRRWTLLSAALAAGMTVTLTAAPATADQPEYIYDRTVTLSQAGSSNLCLDVAGGSEARGANVIQWHCNGGANQKWKLYLKRGTENWQPRTYKLVNVKSEKCLDVEGKSAGKRANVHQWDCQNSRTPGHESQHWLSEIGQDGAWSHPVWRNGKSHLYLCGASFQVGASVVQSSRDGGTRCMWGA